MALEDFFRGQPVGRDMGAGKGDFEIVAQLAGEIALALDPHGVAGRAEDGRAGASNRPAHGACAQSMDMGTTSSIFLAEQGNGAGKSRRG